jgi:protein O-GlcNAc transferase
MFADAIREATQGLRHAPLNAFGLQTLARCQMALGNPAEAMRHWLTLTKVSPKEASFWNQLGFSKYRMGDVEGTEHAFLSAAAANPLAMDAYNNLSLLYVNTGRFADAITNANTAVSLAPASTIALNNLGNALYSAKHFDEAKISYQGVIQLDRKHLNAVVNLGHTLLRLGEIEQARAQYELALEISPTDLRALEGLVELAGSPDAIHAGYKALVAQNLLDRTTYSNFLLNQQYVPDLNPNTSFDAHLEFERLCSPVVAPDARQRRNRTGLDRLRVGLVSGDFRQHSLANFLLPLLSNQGGQVEYIAYSNSAQKDRVSAKLCDRLREFKPIWHLNDSDAANLIRQDRIDVLIDLSGHTALNRLNVFQYRPSSVAVTWLGYLGTTGLNSIDYRLTDVKMDPVGLTDHLHTEKLLRLNTAYAPFTSWLAETEWPEVSTPPSLTSGWTTFGSYNNLDKLSEPCLEAWAKILDRVPNSRLRIANVSRPSQSANAATLFATHGIAADRIDFLPSMGLEAYVASHQAVDIVLDSFPYSGGTISCFALYMGVPVVTLAGNQSAQRAGASACARAWLDDYVVNTIDEYINVAVALASDKRLLAVLRADIRPKFLTNPWNNPAEIAADIEATLLGIAK